MGARLGQRVWRGLGAVASALAFALAAAVTHASWNLILAGRRDSQAATAVALLAAIALAAPVIAFTWRLEAEALPFLVISSTCTVGYMLVLSAAYHRAELSLVYPLARGFGPVVALVGAWLIVGDQPSTCFARVMSGCRTCGSSIGSAS